MTHLPGKSLIFQDEEVSSGYLAWEAGIPVSTDVVFYISLLPLCFFKYQENKVYLKCHTLQATHYLQRPSQEHSHRYHYCPRLVINPLPQNLDSLTYWKAWQTATQWAVTESRHSILLDSVFRGNHGRGLPSGRGELWLSEIPHCLKEFWVQDWWKRGKQADQDARPQYLFSELGFLK